MVKSFDAGEQIIHAKVRDKGIGGNEGQFTTYDAEVQWFDVNVVTFDDPTTAVNEAVASNPVGTTHDFTLQVKGLKLELDPNIDNPAAQTPYIDTDAAGSSYDGVFDAKDAAYFGPGAVLLVDPDDLIKGDYTTDAAGKILTNTNPVTETVQGRVITLSLIGGYTEFDWNHDGYKEEFEGQTGIYLPLQGKDVAFDKGNGPDTSGDESPNSDFTGKSNLGTSGNAMSFDGLVVDGVGTVSPASAVTDAAGEAVVTVASNVKGPETVRAIVDWAGNPHNQSELVKAFAKKAWVAQNDGSDVDISISIEGTEVANNTDGEIAQSTNPVYVTDPATGEQVLNSAHVEVHVKDQFGNDLPDYEVVYLLESLGQTLQGNQGASNTYLPLAYLTDKDTENIIGGVPYDQNDTRPDSNEPIPGSDPFATIVGPGGTESFFFNQWLGAGNPATSTKNVDAGIGVYNGFPGLVTWPIRHSGFGFDAYQEIDGIGEGLLTDGAKAWTLNGFVPANVDQAELLDVSVGDIIPNKLTGSNIDIQLAEDPAEATDASHFKSILKVMVYAPANGLVTDQTPIWEYQVHKIWVEPIPTTITLTPASQVKIAGNENATLTGTVLDQFGTPMAGETVTIVTSILEGTALGNIDGDYTTDAFGRITLTWGQGTTDWGVQSVVASDGAAVSAPAIVDWALNDSPNGFNNTYTQADEGTTTVLLYGLTDFPAWDNKTASVSLSPGGAVLGTGTYDTAADVNVSVPSHTWSVSTSEPFFVHFAGTNGDDAPNWVYNQSGFVD
jgi:hypothetical protein